LVDQGGKRINPICAITKSWKTDREKKNPIKGKLGESKDSERVPPQSRSKRKEGDPFGNKILSGKRKRRCHGYQGVGNKGKYGGGGKKFFCKGSRHYLGNSGQNTEEAAVKRSEI